MSFIEDLPVADIRIGANSHLRVYGDPRLGPPLVMMRFKHRRLDGDLHLTADQADQIAAALVDAAAKARAT